MSSFYFPRMATHIEAYVSSCEHCQRNKNYTVNTRGIPTPMTTPLRRFDVVALDILTFGKQCKNGFDSVVVFTDRLSKRTYISPCYKTATVADLARIFFDTVFRNQGMSRVLLSDNGRPTTIPSTRPLVLVHLFFNLSNHLVLPGIFSM